MFIAYIFVIILMFSANLFAEDLINIEEITKELTEPVQITNAADGSDRLFVVEKSGRVVIIKNNVVLTTPFLDIESKVVKEFELGFLSIAFHPEFEDNNRFFVSYTAETETDGRFETIIAEYKASIDNPDISELEERVILKIEKHTNIHHAGQLQFGHDGFLYISVGDGGFGGDNAQDINTLFGSVLRIDVDGELPYSIPLDNPFVDDDGADKIWAYGFRNPWRFSFDRQNGMLFLGDVGQSCFEEINIIEKAGNYGWNVMEAEHCFSFPTEFDCFEGILECDSSGITLPVTFYSRKDGGTVIGGYVYRGSDIPELFGKYLFGDFQSSTIWSLEETELGVWERTKLIRSGLRISSFGEDEQGEIYVTDHDDGGLYKIIPVATTPTPTQTPIVTPTVTPSPISTPPDSAFSISCKKEFDKGAARLERLVLELGSNDTCILRLTNFDPDTPVEISTIVRSGIKASTKIEPEMGVTDENGELEFTIFAVKRGVDWIAWAVKNEKGEFEFNRKAYSAGLARGMIVKVR